MKRSAATLLFVLCLAGCAGQMPTTLSTPVPSVGKIEKFFIVLVEDDSTAPGGCKVNVQPKGPISSDPDEVKVKHNWRVAWFVVNTCAATAGVVPTIEFALKSDPTKRKDPVKWSDQTSDFLIGKIKSKPADCTDMSSDPPCAILKYTIRFGAAFEDPDIEIIM